jgi:hypothetical protein
MAYLDQYPRGHFAALAKARLTHSGEVEDDRPRR